MRKLKHAAIVWNPKKPEAKKLAARVRVFLAAGGARITGAGRADVLFIVGGDGTLLYNKGRFGMPIFAIGSERSFICQATAANWMAVVRKIMRRGFATERRMMLACEVGGRVIENALNEIVIRSRDHRVIDLHVEVGGRRSEFYADGVLFSTPTGSSAYCYSCGGRELPLHAHMYEVAAIAPYRRLFRPVVVPDSTACTAWTMSGSADLVFDGQFIHRMKPGARVRIRKSARTVELVKA
jgi:NAD+ kinase